MAATRLPSCVDGNTEKRLFNLIILAVLTPVLSGCAAPASIVQPNDAQLRCRDIDAEMQSNETRIKEIHIANIGQNTTTAAVGSVGATVFPPLLLALPVMQIFNSSFSDRSDIETLRSRNAHLAELRTKRGCRASRAN